MKTYNYNILFISIAILFIVYSNAASAQKIPTIDKLNKNTCYQPGEKIVIYGDNLGTRKNYNLALANQQKTIVIDNIKQWQEKTITATLPKDIESLANNGRLPKTLIIGIRQSSTWLSNRDVNIEICTTIQNTHIKKIPTNTKPIDLDENLDDNRQATENNNKNSNENVLNPTNENTTQEERKIGTLKNLGIPPVITTANSSNNDKNRIEQEPKEAIVISNSMEDAISMAKWINPFGIRIKRRNQYTSLGIVISVLGIPPDLDTNDVIEKLRAANNNLWIDANHRYSLLNTSIKPSLNPKEWSYEILGWTDKHRNCKKNQKIGVIDTGIIDSTTLNQNQIIRKNILNNGVTPAKKNHGTAIASLLLGSTKNNMPGLLPTIKIYSAEVFRQRTEKEIDTTTELIIKALAWMADEKIPVLNLSFGGPRNLTLEVVIKQLHKKGIVTIAAAGINTQGNPLYPAAQQGVIAVSAIDANHSPLTRDIFGEYIDFAAPGGDLWLLNEKGKGRYLSGSSFAAPFVAASYLLLNQNSEPYDLLKKQSKDLGNPGKDQYFGWGLIYPSDC